MTYRNVLSILQRLCFIGTLLMLAACGGGGGGDTGGGETGGVTDTQAPSTPAGLQVTQVSSTRVDLSWDPAIDIRGSRVIGSIGMGGCRAT
jgi:hypothetical protein